VIHGIVLDFLQKPYNSVEDPLDLWYHQLAPGSLVEPMTVGYSVGLGKAMACLMIMDAGVTLFKAGELGDADFAVFGQELIALMAMKAMTAPEADIETQVNTSLAKKFRVSGRPRPHIIQLYTAFQRTLMSKRAKGDKRPLSTVMGQIIKTYNSSQMVAKQRVSSDERDALLNLISQTPQFLAMISKHWQSFEVEVSAVPVSLLKKEFLSDGYEPPVKRTTSPKFYAALSGSPEKRDPRVQTGAAAEALTPSPR
jgi:hypothetical protein